LYMAPELLKGHIHEEPSDVFAFAIILLVESSLVFSLSFLLLCVEAMGGSA